MARTFEIHWHFQVPHQGRLIKLSPGEFPCEDRLLADKIAASPGATEKHPSEVGKATKKPEPPAPEKPTPPPPPAPEPEPTPPPAPEHTTPAPPEPETPAEPKQNIGAMTKAELRGMLDEWGVEQPSSRATHEELVALVEAQLGAS